MIHTTEFFNRSSHASVYAEALGDGAREPQRKAAQPPEYYVRGCRENKTVWTSPKMIFGNTYLNK
jgi:hypothetical protein